jgi:hypothetical protein
MKRIANRRILRRVKKKEERRKKKEERKIYSENGENTKTKKR